MKFLDLLENITYMEIKTVKDSGEEIICIQNEIQYPVNKNENYSLE